MIQGDYLEVVKSIPDGSVDMVLADLPYGTTTCKWDEVIPFAPLWESLHRVCADNGAIVHFAKNIFTADLVSSNKHFFRYSLVWKKSRVSNFAQAKLRFLDTHEDILVFSKGKCSKNSKICMKFNPQGLVPWGKRVKDTSHRNSHREARKGMPDYIQDFTNYPKSILEFPSDPKPVHPTQKPVPLLEYLIKTYTNEGDTVLDPTMGSGSTGVACKNLGRKFIGIEKEQNYFEIARKRIESISIQEELHAS